MDETFWIFIGLDFRARVVERSALQSAEELTVCEAGVQNICQLMLQIC